MTHRNLQMCECIHKTTHDWGSKNPSVDEEDILNAPPQADELWTIDDWLVKKGISFIQVSNPDMLPMLMRGPYANVYADNIEPIYVFQTQSKWSWDGKIMREKLEDLGGKWWIWPYLTVIYMYEILKHDF